MKLQFTDGRLERGAARGKFDLLIGAIATFTICVGDRVLYTEVMTIKAGGGSSERWFRHVGEG